jgi:hypothetical protein
MMSKIVENMYGRNQDIVRVAETYLHESGHQCGLVHDTNKPDCADGTVLNISREMNPDGHVRRAYTRIQWCVVRSSVYVTTDDLTPFTQAPELPDSGTAPSGPIG